MNENIQTTIELLDEALLNLSLAHGVLEGVAVITPPEIDRRLQLLGHEAKEMRRESARVNGRPLQDWQLDVLGVLIGLDATGKGRAMTKPEIAALRATSKPVSIAAQLAGNTSWITSRHPHYQTNNWRSLVAKGLLGRYKCPWEAACNPGRPAKQRLWKWYVTELGRQIQLRARNIYEGSVLKLYDDLRATYWNKIGPKNPYRLPNNRQV
jgi:hypothetical protein